jgi:hypothetical protein
VVWEVERQRDVMGGEREEGRGMWGWRAYIVLFKQLTGIVSPEL